MEKMITLTVNGRPRKVTTDPQRPLIEVLREDLELTGTKCGCGEGRCGSCTVLIDGKARLSCITPVGDVEERAILTIEGLAAGEELHPVQEAFLAEGALQCGYCTPGMILGVVDLLAEKPNPTDADLLAKMGPHLCRCCGYPNILKAIKRAAMHAGRS
jgi:aerobic-type carbon monoxide dehydrogenase small subunit (CoxS/CutS family)